MLLVNCLCVSVCVCVRATVSSPSIWSQICLICLADTKGLDSVFSLEVSVYVLFHYDVEADTLYMHLWHFPRVLTESLGYLRLIRP